MFEKPKQKKYDRGLLIALVVVAMVMGLLGWRMSWWIPIAWYSTGAAALLVRLTLPGKMDRQQAAALFASGLLGVVYLVLFLRPWLKS